MSTLKQIAQTILRVVAGIVSLAVMLGVGLIAFGALIITTLAVVLRIKWLQRKFEKRTADPRMMDAEKTEQGNYSVSGL